MRPYCPRCNRELVFCAIAGPDMMIPSWVCDCELRLNGDVAPYGLITDIVRAREYNDGSLVFDLTIRYPVLEQEYSV